MTTTENVFDSVPAHTIEAGDQVMLDGDPVEVKSVEWATDDGDAIIIKGYSHETGDSITYTVFADDMYDLWAV